MNIDIGNLHKKKLDGYRKKELRKSLFSQEKLFRWHWTDYESLRINIQNICFEQKMVRFIARISFPLLDLIDFGINVIGNILGRAQLLLYSL